MFLVVVELVVWVFGVVLMLFGLLCVGVVLIFDVVCVWW